LLHEIKTNCIGISLKNYLLGIATSPDQTFEIRKLKCEEGGSKMSLEVLYRVEMGVAKASTHSHGRNVFVGDDSGNVHSFELIG